VRWGGAIRTTQRRWEDESRARRSRPGRRRDPALAPQPPSTTTTPSPVAPRNHDAEPRGCPSPAAPRTPALAPRPTPPHRARRQPGATVRPARRRRRGRRASRGTSARAARRTRRRARRWWATSARRARPRRRGCTARRATCASAARRTARPARRRRGVLRRGQLEPGRRAGPGRVVVRRRRDGRGDVRRDPSPSALHAGSLRPIPPPHPTHLRPIPPTHPTSPLPVREGRGGGSVRKNRLAPSPTTRDLTLPPPGAPHPPTHPPTTARCPASTRNCVSAAAAAR
jgi:hypothetical protein